MEVLPSIVPTSRLEKYDVVNPDGEDLGQVQNFMLDMQYGRIAFVVVAFGGVLGITDKWFALPWEILAWSPENRKFVLNIPREVFESAPGIDKDRWPYEVDLSWIARCYDYYGCAPYWQGEREENVKKLAYGIWEQEDRPEGKHLEHYYRAEKILAGKP